jgi:hypothetical protein
VEALRAAGPEPTRESFVAALESVRVEGVFVKPIAWGPERRHGYNAVALHRTGAGPDDPPEIVVEAEEFPPLF